MVPPVVLSSDFRSSAEAPVEPSTRVTHTVAGITPYLLTVDFASVLPSARDPLFPKLQQVSPIPGLAQLRCPLLQKLLSVPQFRFGSPVWHPSPVSPPVGLEFIILPSGSFSVTWGRQWGSRGGDPAFITYPASTHLLNSGPSCSHTP